MTFLKKLNIFYMNAKGKELMDIMPQQVVGRLHQILRKIDDASICKEKECYKDQVAM